MKKFSELVADLNQGQIEVELEKQLAKVINAVNTHNGKGSISLKLSITPNGDGTISMQPSVDSKAPKQRLRSAIYFSDENGLHTENPRQAKLFQDKNVVRLPESAQVKK